MDEQARSAPDPVRAPHGQGLADASVFERIQTDVKAEVDTGVQYALAAPYPDASQVDEDVYA